MPDRVLRGGVFVLCLLPFVCLIWSLAEGSAGPDPAKTIMLSTGEWSLRFLALTLLASPLRRWTGWSLVLRLRRMLGLYSFFYACVHLLTFAHFYLGWSVALLLEELVERPYISAGALGWLLLLPLAITSTRGWQRRLRRNWGRLHRLVYPAAVLACLHLLWQARSDVGEALLYGAVFSGLLGWRAWRARGSFYGSAKKV